MKTRKMHFEDEYYSPYDDPRYPRTNRDEDLLKQIGFTLHGRTKYTDPYSYDPFIIHYDGSKIDKTIHTAYHDRMQSWNWEKWESAAKKHLKQRFENESKENIQSFLRDYWDKPDLKLVFVVEGCNVSSGYPYWVFGWRER